MLFWSGDLGFAPESPSGKPGVLLLNYHRLLAGVEVIETSVTDLESVGLPLTDSC